MFGFNEKRDCRGGSSWTECVATMKGRVELPEKQAG
jgi:hypothetical protein